MFYQFWLKLSKRFSKKPLAHATGERSEAFAAKHLKEKGYKVVVRNWKSHPDEIDLICKWENTLVFVEVRGRQADAAVKGFHSLTTNKRRALKRASRAYLNGMASPPRTWRWDVIEVDCDLLGKPLEIRHFENVQL
jgi:putative endonuclease